MTKEKDLLFLGKQIAAVALFFSGMIFGSHIPVMEMELNLLIANTMIIFISAVILGLDIK